MSETRRHHYQYAHHWLRGWFENSPEAALARLTHDDAVDLLARLWDDLGSRLPEDEQVLSPDGLGLARRCVDHETGESDYFAIVEMPTPQSMTECYYIAMVVRSPDGRIVPEHLADEDRGSQSYYYTLEYTLQSDFVTPSAVVCSWSENGGRHNNHGGDWTPDIDDFVDEVERLIGPPPAVVH